MGKREIARNEQFLHFPQCFQVKQITLSPFVHICDIISLFAIELEEPEIGMSVKGLIGQAIEISDVINSTKTCAFTLNAIYDLDKLASLKKKPGEVSITIFKYFIRFKF